MPRKCMHPRQGSPWDPRRPHTSSLPSGSSTPGLECFTVVDTSWTSAWCSPFGRHSSSPPVPRHGRPHHNPKTPSPKLPREHSAILYDLVFELRDGVNDLQFRVQQMEGRLSTLLQLLATPPPAAPENSSDAPEKSSDNGSSHQLATKEESPPGDGKAGSPGSMTALAWKENLESSVDGDDVAVSAAIVEGQDTSIQVHEDKCNNATDMQWTASGTPVIEEPWPGLLPEYVPDHTMLVSYFSSNGSHGS